MASRHHHCEEATTYFLRGVHLLERVVVNSGMTGATVTVRYAGSDAAIAVIAADDPDIGRVFNLRFSGTDLEVVLSHPIDVTVLFD